MIRTWLTRSKERTCNPAGRPSRDEKDTDLKNSRDDWEWYFYLVLYCITGHKLILHQKSARAGLCVKMDSGRSYASEKSSLTHLFKLNGLAKLYVRTGVVMVFPTARLLCTGRHY